MSSNIQIARLCVYCGNEFTARTTTTKYCSKTCNSRHYKAKARNKKVERSNTESRKAKTKSIDELTAKPYLTVRDAATILNCSIRTTYRLIEIGKLKAVNIAERKTLIRRKDIDKLFEQPKPKQQKPKVYDIKDCYNLTEIQNKYGISEKALHDVIKRNKLKRIRKGWYAYVPKIEIDKILS